MARVAQAAATVDLPGFLSALKAVRKGDFSVRLPDDWVGVAGKVADTFNEVVEMNQRLASELERLRLAIGQHGKITERASVGPVSGAWADSVANVNSLVASLVQPTSEAARVIGAVAKGDLSQSMALEVDDRPLEGEFLRSAKTVNLMVEQLRSFAAEVTRVAREVGTEGKLGGQADVRDVAGTWKDLTDSVNSMAGNLTAQVRNIAEVTTAVANGDLSRKITVDVRGEVLELKNTINTMVDQLRSFAAEVTRVAREVGTEGKLGGQADVRDVAGTWKDLTDSVNSMAGNLTAQVRNIAEVTTAVANGDLSRRSPSTCAARCSSSRTRSTRWSTSSAPSPPRSRASRARSAPRASSAARPESKACPVPGATSPTRSTRWPATSPPRCATSPRSPPPSPTATCRGRSPSTSRARSSSSRTRSTRWSTSSARSRPR